MQTSIKKAKNKILNISNILTQTEKRMLENSGYILLSGGFAKRADNSKEFKIKKIDNILFLQLNS